MYVNVTRGRMHFVHEDPGKIELRLPSNMTLSIVTRGDPGSGSSSSRMVEITLVEAVRPEPAKGK